jgi:hypothetical protein
MDVAPDEIKRSDELNIVSVRLSHPLAQQPNMDMNVGTQPQIKSWNEKSQKEKKEIEKAFNTVKPELVSQLAEEEYSHCYELITKTPEQMINDISIPSIIYEDLLKGFCKEEIRNDINQYLRTGNLSFETSTGFDNDSVEKKRLDAFFYSIISKMTQMYYITYESINPRILDLLFEKMGLTQKELPPFWSIEIINPLFKTFNGRLALLPFKEKMDILIRLYDVSFNSKIKINGVALVKTTSNGDIFYRGIKNLSAGAFKDEIQNNPKTPAYILTTSNFSIAALNAILNTETTDPNKFVIKLICDPGIGIINLSNTVAPYNSKWKDEFLFPRGCSLNFMSLEELESYEVFKIPGSTSPAQSGPMTVVTVRVSGPDSSPIGGKRRTKKNRKHRNRNSKKHRNRNSKKHRNRNSKKRHTRKH